MRTKFNLPGYTFHLFPIFCFCFCWFVVVVFFFSVTFSIFLFLDFFLYFS